MIRWILIGWLALAVSACAPMVAPPNAPPEPPKQTLTGIVSVIDGDTIDMHGQRLRLYGMDAFESGQRCRDGRGALFRCGREAAMALDALVRGQTVRCDVTGKDRYDRLIARCSTAAAGDVSAALVEQGWALAFTRYSQRYVAQEAAARRGQRGAWAGAFDAPADWRAGRRSDLSS